MINKLDRIILNELQKGLPITRRPFYTIAKRVRLSEKEVLERIKRLKEKGLIRKIQTSFDYQKLGYQGTLVGVKARGDKLKKLAKKIGSDNGVTHSYLRLHEYNLWFTLIAKSKKEIATILENIKKTFNLKEDEFLNLPALETFKLEVIFNLK